MTDRDALYRAIIAHPDDDTPRLVYADWLEENDDAEQAEFIRIGCRLEAASPDHPDYAEWLARQKELTIWLATHTPGPKLRFDAGLAVSGESDWWRTSRRGFPRYLEFDGNHHHGAKAMRLLAASLEEAFTKLPTRWLAVRFITNDQLAELLRQPIIGQLDHLTVQLYTQGEPNDEAAQLIADCKHLRNLRGASLGFDVGEPGANALSQSEHLGRLEWFSIPGELTPNVVRAFGVAEWFRNLRVLLLGNDIPEPGFEELCRNGPFPRLHTLDTHQSGFTSGAWQQAFAESKSFPMLTRLALVRTPLADGMTSLVRAKWFRPAYVNLDNCVTGNEGAATLAASPWLKSVQWLCLRGNFLGASGVAAIAKSRKLTGVKHLDLSNNAIGVSGLRAITANPALRGLIGLKLGGGEHHTGHLAPTHFHEFLSKLDMPQLRYLSLRGRPLGAKAARLLTSEKFATLTRLDLGHCGLTDAVVKALLAAPALQNLIELRLENNNLKDGPEPLTDPDVMPRLGACYIGANAISANIGKKLARRPGIVS